MYRDNDDFPYIFIFIIYQHVLRANTLNMKDHEHSFENPIAFNDGTLKVQLETSESAEHTDLRLQADKVVESWKA